MEVTPTQVIDLATLRSLCASGEAKRIRLGSHLSLAEVAAAVGTCGITLARWEQGIVKPRNGEPAARYARLLAELCAVGEQAK